MFRHRKFPVAAKSARLSLERLESRLLLSGNVVALVSGWVAVLPSTEDGTASPCR